jgi:hypothetical protein
MYTNETSGTHFHNHFETHTTQQPDNTVTNLALLAIAATVAAASVIFLPLDVAVVILGADALISFFFLAVINDWDLGEPSPRYACRDPRPPPRSGGPTPGFDYRPGDSRGKRGGGGPLAHAGRVSSNGYRTPTGDGRGAAPGSASSRSAHTGSASSNERRSTSQGSTPINVDRGAAPGAAAGRRRRD